MGLLLAVKWVQRLGLTDVVVELDAKIVVDAFNLVVFPNYEFGCILRACKDIF